MGSLDKRIEDLERHLGSREPARLHVMYEDTPDEVLYTVTVPGLAKTPEQERDGGA